MKQPTQAEWTRLKRRRAGVTQGTPQSPETPQALPDDLFLPDDYGVQPTTSEGPERARAGRLERERLPHSSKLFDPVLLDQLADRTWDEIFPPLTRLYHYLRIRSRRGARPVRLTNEMASEIGISRSHKSERLKELEALGLIEVAREGRKTLEVRVLTLKRPVPSK